MNTVTITIEEYDKLREIKKAFVAKFGYIEAYSNKFVSLNRDEQIEKLEEEYKKLSNEQIERHLERMNDIKVRMGREVEEYREKYRKVVEENVELTLAFNKFTPGTSRILLFGIIVVSMFAGFIISTLVL
jgi:hypothetical protein